MTSNHKVHADLCLWTKHIPKIGMCLAILHLHLCIGLYCDCASRNCDGMCFRDVHVPFTVRLGMWMRMCLYLGKWIGLRRFSLYLRLGMECDWLYECDWWILEVESTSTLCLSKFLNQYMQLLSIGGFDVESSFLYLFYSFVTVNHISWSLLVVHWLEM